MFDLQWVNAAENVLDHIHRVGLGGRFGVTVLVGARCDDSVVCRELVGGIPQRVVLAHSF